MNQELPSSSRSQFPSGMQQVRATQSQTVTIQLTGGLGNQMFQYAFGRAIAGRTGMALVLDAGRGFADDRYGRKLALTRLPLWTGTRVADETGIASWIPSNPWILRLIARAQGAVNWGSPRIYCEHVRFGHDERVLQQGISSYYAGYWQNPRYFSEIGPELRMELTLREPKMTDPQNDLLNRVRSSNSVAIHVRCYDVADLKLFGKIRADQLTLERSYYDGAVATLMRTERDLRFFVFGDDLRTEPRLTGGDQFVQVDRAEIGDDATEQWLMSQCRHQIIANSTYSWWAAWLNPHSAKKVIAPRKWFRSSLSNDGIFPSDWLVLG